MDQDAKDYTPEERAQKEKVMREVAARMGPIIEQLERDVLTLERHMPIYAEQLELTLESLKRDENFLLKGADVIARRRRQMEAARNAILAEQSWGSVRS